eukprot:8348743-Alexandrium_andersonii.AAC.1
MCIRDRQQEEKADEDDGEEEQEVKTEKGGIRGAVEALQAAVAEGDGAEVYTKEQMDAIGEALRALQHAAPEVSRGAAAEAERASTQREP